MCLCLRVGARVICVCLRFFIDWLCVIVRSGVQGIGLDADQQMGAYWILIYFERLFGCFVLFPIMLSFQSMMKSRMLQAAGVMSDSQNLNTHDDGVSLKANCCSLCKRCVRVCYW